MKFVEESEDAFSAAQLAAAERELEQQKKEWELDRLRALREEEERRMRLADDDEKPLTFGREDAQNQVNSAIAKSGSKRLINKKLAISNRRGLRRRRGRSRGARELLVKSETESTSTESDSESESQEEDVVEDSLDEESSHTESQSQGDEGEEEEGDGGGEENNEKDEEKEASEENEDGRANNGDNSERGGDFSRRRSRLVGSGSFNRNHFDLNSPRTRSRGNVHINLWTLDVSPILPSIKRRRFHRAKSEETLPSPTSVDSCSKRNVRINANKLSVGSNQNVKSETAGTVNRNTSKDDRDSISVFIDSNGVEQCVDNTNIERSVDHLNSTPITKTQTGQTKTLELDLDKKDKSVKDERIDKSVKEEKNDKITNYANRITICSVQVTRCPPKIVSAIYRKSELEINRNEDAENLDVNVSTRDSRSPSSTAQSDTSLKRSKETTAKSKSEFGMSANSLCNNTRSKLISAVSKESENSVESSNRRNVESSSNRSFPVLRSKTLRNGSPDTTDKLSKQITMSRVSVAVQRNPKNPSVNTDDIHCIVVEDKDKDGRENDEDIDTMTFSTRKNASLKLNSKNDMRENSELDFLSEGKTSESTLDACDSSAFLTKDEAISNEPKCKMRKVEVANTRSIITRSSKIPSNINNHSEESNTMLSDKIDLVLETDSSSQVKTSQGTRRIDNPQHLEQSRITRSTTSYSSTPSSPLVDDETTTQILSKSMPKRRPDTPLPRPITRSTATASSPTRIDGALPNRGEKNAMRNSKQYQDNGVLSPHQFRRSRSIPPMKSDPNSKETPVVASAKRSDVPRQNVPMNSNNEHVSRITRSGLVLNSISSIKSPSSSSSVPVLRTSVKRTSLTSNENENTDIASSFEKPQRTAKVVAILTLDTRNNHTSNKTVASIQSKSASNETKMHDKEALVSRLSDSLSREQEADRESCDLVMADSKSKRLRREAKRSRHVACTENGSNDDTDEEPQQKRSCRSSQLSPSPSPSIMTRSEKLKSATIS